MEQPNMMPNGMGGGNMNMAMNSMQRPQSGNTGQQIHAAIMEHLRANLSGLPQGWQQTFDIRERASRIIQMVTQLRQLDNQISKCISIAENWEQRTIRQCPNKGTYFAAWNQKFAEITRKREDQAAQMGLGMPQNNMGNMHNLNNMQQNGGMNGMNNMNNMNAMNAMGGMNFNGMGMPNGGNMGMPNQMNMGQQAGFPQQLQRQMQPSPMPPQNQQPQNGSIDPAALTQNPQMQNHMPNQMSQPTPQQRQQQQQQQGGMNPNQGGPPNGPSENEVRQIAKQMYDSTPDDRKKHLRAQFINSLSDQQKQAFQARGVDPLNRLFMQRARETLLKRSQQQQQQGGGMNMAEMGNNMQQNTSQAGQQSFDFSSMMGQRANAIKSQESGGEVVPASNNNNNMMQQGGNNPQPVMNFNQNGSANGNNQQQQMLNNMQFAAMQEKQKREQMAKKNQMAQQQALAQQNQLRGQPGGLNAPNALNGGQVNSPAMNMNMLNRPTFPPGQTTPNTPHQNQGMQNQPPQTPSTGANQLQQHHQNMLSQNQSQLGLENIPPQQRQLLMKNLNPEMQMKLANMPQDKINLLMERFHAQRQNAMNPHAAQQNSQNMNMGVQALQSQSSMGGMGNGMNGMNGFNGQPPNQQQAPMDQQAGLHQKLQQHQNNQIRQKAMDMKAFPKNVLNSLSLSVPDFVNTWEKLKQHIAQNQSVLPQGLMERLNAMQSQWALSHTEELNAAVEQLKRMIMNRQQAGQGQQQGGPQGMAMPNGQAPQAQMVAPPAQMQQQQQQQQPQARPQDDQFIPQETVNMLRARMPQAKAMTDDKIREMMRNRRSKQVAQANQDMQQSLRNAQMNAQPPPRTQQMPAGGAQPTPQQAGQRSQQQGQGQKRSNSDEVMEIPNPNAAAAQPPQPMQHNQQRGGMPQMPNVPGLKSNEELEAMPVEQRNAYMRRMREMSALKNAQMGIGATQQQAQNVAQMQQPPQQQPPQPPSQQMTAQNPAIAKLQKLFGEVGRSHPKGPEVQLDPRSMQQAKELLKKLWPIVHTLDKALVPGLHFFGEDKVREAIKIKQIILQNAADAQGNIKTYLGVSLETLKRSEQFIGTFLRDLQVKRNSLQGQQQGQGGQNASKQDQTSAPAAAQQQQKQAQQAQGKPATPAAPQTAAPQKAPAAPPLNRKNSSQHARKASQNKAPPAPTENKTFDWASPTPHGVPKYDQGRTELTADKLKIPPQKKRKTTDSQDSTPATQTGTPAGASPQVTSGSRRDSPEQMRKMLPQPQEPEKPRFACNDPFCQASTQGFESEELLKKHNQEEHQPIEDPFKFLMDTVDNGLAAVGMDKDGKPLPVKATAPTARRPPAAQKVADRKAAAASATPALKAESATPATPASAGKGTTKPGLATPAGKKPAESKAPEEERTLYDTIVDQLGIEILAQPADEKTVPDAPQSPWSQHLADMLKGFDDADNTDNNEWNWDWANIEAPDVPRVVPLAVGSDSSDSASSSQLTPASSVNSSNSEINISEAQRLKMIFEWDPAGNGDTCVPEKLRRMVLSEEQQRKEQDVEMGGVGEGGKKDEWDWSGDRCDWDALFGPESGIVDDGGFAAAFGGDSGVL